MRWLSAGEQGQLRRVGGLPIRCWLPSRSRDGTTRHGSGGSPRSGSPWPAAAPARGAPPPHSEGHAGGDRSSGVGSGLDASAAAWPAASTTRAGSGAAAAAPAQPTPRGLPSRPAAGPSDVAAPRLRGVTPAARRLLLPSSSPAAQPSHHLAEQQIDQSYSHAPIIVSGWLPSRTPQLRTYTRISGTHKAVAGTDGHYDVIVIRLRLRRERGGPPRGREGLQRRGDGGGQALERREAAEDELGRVKVWPMCCMPGCRPTSSPRCGR
jgi:hypothetical protein